MYKQVNTVHDCVERQHERLLGSKVWESGYMDGLTKGRLLNMKRPGLQYECLSTLSLITK